MSSGVERIEGNEGHYIKDRVHPIVAREEVLLIEYHVGRRVKVHEGLYQVHEGVWVPRQHRGQIWLRNAGDAVVHHQGEFNDHREQRLPDVDHVLGLPDVGVIHQELVEEVEISALHYHFNSVSDALVGEEQLQALDGSPHCEADHHLSPGRQTESELRELLWSGNLFVCLC